MGEFALSADYRQSGIPHRLVLTVQKRGSGKLRNATVSAAERMRRKLVGCAEAFELSLNPKRFLQLTELMFLKARRKTRQVGPGYAVVTQAAKIFV
jgi:hypothetical protein